MRANVRTAWTLGNVRVKIHPQSEMLPHFRPNGKYASLVQRALDDATDNLYLWRQPEEYFINCTELDTQLIPLAIKLTDALRERVVWGVHSTHRKDVPQLSPFVQPVSSPKSHLLTVELSGSPDQPILERVYTPPVPNDEVPPLPWMDSAKKWPTGRESCKAYWRDHAFYFGHGARGTYVRGSLTNKPPLWWIDLA